MALDVFAIPAMAADCERSFSIAKLTLSSQRHAIKWETIEMLQMLKNRLRNGDIVIGGVMKGSRPGWESVRSSGVTISCTCMSDPFSSGQFSSVRGSRYPVSSDQEGLTELADLRAALGSGWHLLAACPCGNHFGCSETLQW
jgi:hypothetical protein